MNPRVTHVLPHDDFTLTLTFSDGQTRRFDVKPYLTRGIFTELAQPAYFRQAAVVEGTVAWPHDQDFCPDTLFLDSMPLATIENANC
jgi:hypothetical protein